MQGKFIVFDGIDGCGKSTQLLKAVEYVFKVCRKKSCPALAGR
jgi:thymidylate kinase